MNRRVLMFIMVLLLGLGGCATNGYQGIKPEAYPATRKAFDVTIGWKKALTDNGMTVEGYARNNRYFIIKGLELRVSLIAPDGAAKTSESFLFSPLELRQDEMAPFAVVLRVPPQPGDRLRFDYRYLAVEDSENSQTWLDSFEVKALD